MRNEFKKRGNKEDRKRGVEMNPYYSKMDEFLFQPELDGYNDFLLIDTENYVEDKLKNNMTKTQMRNVFDLIKNCNSADELKMTKPKLLYTAGRLSGEPKRFLVKLSEIVMNADRKENVEQFHKFIETILAYHKYYAKN